MANSLSITVGYNGTVNGLTVNNNGSINLAPTGSILFAESMFVQTSSYQQVYSGSSQVIGSIFAANTGTTGSLQIAVSSSGLVYSLGQLGPAGTNANNPSVIQWNQSLSGLYAQAVGIGGYGVFTIAAQ